MAQGNSTGERIRGSKVREIIQLAINGEPIERIASTVKVNWRTANAIVQNNCKPIAERKIELANTCFRIATKATERIEDEIDSIPVQNLTVVAGVHIDKLIALTQEPVNQINQHLHVHLNPSNVIEQFNKLVDKINGNEQTIDVNVEPAPTPEQG